MWQIFRPEVALIRDQVLINVGAYDPKYLNFYNLLKLNFPSKFSILAY